MSEHEPTPCDYSRLPPELWGLVVECLQRTDQRNCLSVSAAFRALARPLVFSRIVIHVGFWSTQELNWYRLTESELQLIKWRSIAAKEILQCIARDAQFAWLVKTLSVLAYQRPPDGQSDLDFTAHIVSALESLPHLRSFQWYGSRPPLSSSILDILVRTAGSSLTELDISGVVGLDEDASPYLAQFKSLQTLSLAGNSNHFPISTGYGGDSEAITTTCVQHVPDTLLHLSIWRDAVRATPLRVFSVLHELSVMNPRSLDRLGVLFAHCTQLRSLAITAGGANCESEVLAALQAAPDALPHLTMFKLVLWGEAVVTDPSPFITFFQNKKGMRRLDFSLNCPLDRMDAYTRFLDVIAQLPRLEVVGLELEGTVFCSDHLRLLDERLPLGLTGLLLKWSFPSVEATLVEQNWANMLKKRPSLRYFHVLDHIQNLDLRDQLLKDHSWNLKLVGYGARIRSIERDRVTSESMYGPLWSDAAIAFELAEDFGCRDWVWLLQYHDWDRFR